MMLLMIYFDMLQAALMASAQNEYKELNKSCNNILRGKSHLFTYLCMNIAFLLRASYQCDSHIALGAKDPFISTQMEYSTMPFASTESRANLIGFRRLGLVLPFKKINKQNCRL